MPECPKYENENDNKPEYVDEPDEAIQLSEPARLYKSPEARYEDARSTAFTFFLVGGLGLLVMVLTFAGVLKLPFHSFAEFTMTGLFIIFLIIGALSYRSAGKMKNTIQEENALIDGIKNWYQTEGCKDLSLPPADDMESEEIRYLQRYEALRMLLREHFPDTDEALLDKLASDFCES